MTRRKPKPEAKTVGGRQLKPSTLMMGHGYDPALPSMHGFFLAHGPSFARGVTLPAFENVNVYALLCAVLGLTPAEHDGDTAVTRAALRSESR